MTAHQHFDVIIEQAQGDGREEKLSFDRKKPPSELSTEELAICLNRLGGFSQPPTKAEKRIPI